MFFIIQLAEINGLGLLISSPTRKEEGPIEDEHKTQFADVAADADHDNWWEEEGGDVGGGGEPQKSTSMEKGLRNYSNRTSIRSERAKGTLNRRVVNPTNFLFRFYLRRRAASIQELLEKMFERQV